MARETEQMRAKALELQGVGKAFDGVAALEAVSLTLEKGQIACLLGQSGCGKSTLLRLIAGVERPDAGSIFLDGAQVVGPSRFVEPEARKIGFMFQDYALFPHLTVRENIAFGLKGLPRVEIEARVSEMMARIGIEVLADRHPHTLSGGEQQRVALARALAPKPVLLLMDEPFSNLDRGLRERLRHETLTHLRALETTTVMVTHDPEEALAVGDKVVLLRAGLVEQEGTAHALFDNPETLYAAEFLSPGTRVPGRVVKGAVETALGRFDAPQGMQEGQAAILFLRPHALSLAAADQPLAVFGKLVGRVFMGDRDSMSVAVDGLSEPLQFYLRGFPQFSQGDQVRLSIDPAGALVYPA